MTLHRRQFLTAAAGAAALGAAGTVSAQSEPDYGGWFDGVGNYDGTVDMRGQDTVEITVGAQGNGGAFAFDPAAVMVSPGTEVVWTWTGEGGGHNVVSDGDGPLNSGDPVSSADTTYSHTFDGEGIYKYVCSPHAALGMKGAVVVRSGGGGTSQTPQGPPADPDYEGWFDGVGNYDGETVDRTGEDTVEITVGAQGNGGAFAFDPPAVRVEPGTEVVWTWSGEGGGHNVVSDGDGPLNSGGPVSSADTTYSHTFEETGIYRYVCTPHETLGMKGAVVVGGPLGGSGSGSGSGAGGGGRADIELSGPQWLLTGSVLVAFFSPLLFAAAMRRRYRERPPSTAETDLERASATGPQPVEEAPEAAPEVAVGHEEYDPWGTATLVAMYLVLIALLWVFMYFVEFLGRVSVIG